MSSAFRAIGRMTPPLLLASMLLAGCADPPEPSRCFSSDQCEGGLCIEGGCVARKGAGEACTRWAHHDETGFLGAASDCALELACSSLSLRCSPPAPLGARCGDDGDCGAHPSYRSADDPVCVPGGGTSACASPRTVPPGGACQGDRACADGLRCMKNADDSSTCRGPGAEGELCDRGSYWREDPTPLCVPGLYCAGTPPVCRARFELGEACEGADCLEGLVCRSASKTCAWAAALSEACGGDSDCADGFACIVGSCAPPSPRGGPCSNHEHCTNGDRCILGACSSPSSPGLLCSNDDDCAAGLRCEMGSCRAHQAVPGDRCESDYSCLWLGPCVDNVCVEKSGTGGPCSDFSGCADGLFCQVGVCVQQRPDGAPCASSLECRSTICIGRPALCTPSP